jgi:hypothetical protein
MPVFRLVLFTLWFASSTAFAAVVNSSSSTISSVLSYTELESGDVIFQLTTNSISACNLGFWIRGTDAGSRSVLAQILAAYHTATPVTVSADNATFWPGSTTGAACLVLAVMN